MANPKGNAAALAPTTFKPGASGNPGGKPVGSRNRLQGSFLSRLADDFDRFGVRAIARLRRDDVSSYIRAIASLMPKEIEVSRPMAEMNDDELASAIALVQSHLSASAAARKPAKAGREQAAGVSTLQ